MTRTIRALIVDDEPLARRGLELRLQAYPEVEVLDQCAHGEALLQRLAQGMEPDVIFLDVQMPGMDGFQTLAAIPEERRPLVVFVTAFDQHAVQAFEACALDYLLKPVEDERLARTLERVREALQGRGAEDQRERLLALLRRISGRPDLQLEEALADPFERGAGRDPEVLAIRDAGRILRVPLDSIRWIEAAGDYMCINTDDGTHVLRATLRDLENQLDPGRFQRVHRSSIVNIRRVRSLRPHINGEYFLQLDSGHEVKLSRSYRDKLDLLR
ncbi:MAG: DNA-binding response regulator [Lysobacteraceae bacterium]|nr:MAG: DNA-binding response regulator [Xanthomonadaceae bacterium]